MAFPLPEKPPIAVLPFDNLSDDSKQEYFSDGLTEEIITALSKSTQLFIIARNSTFTYKGEPVKIQQVAKDLGVRYVLEGSVRKSGEQLRIIAQLIDATTGIHMWTERYDRSLRDIFALQDEITLNIIKALGIKLTEGEQINLFARETDNLEAYLKVLQSIEHFRQFSPKHNILSRQNAEDAIALDPNYPNAWSMVAWTRLLEAEYGWAESAEFSFKQGAEIAKKLFDLDPAGYMTHYLMSYVHILEKNYEKAISEIEKAVSLNPNVADINAFYGMILRYEGRLEEAENWLKKAIRLNPIPPSWYLKNLASAYFAMERYDDAIKFFKRVLDQNPNFYGAHIGLAAAYSIKGMEEEASEEKREVLKINPKFSLAAFAEMDATKDKAEKKRFIDALRKAGLPE